MDTTHFVTSHQVEYIITLITIIDNFIQDGTLNFWSLSACLEDTMQVTKSSLRQGAAGGHGGQAPRGR
jgi:hypothetical protein